MSYEEEVGRLQEQLGRAREAGDVKGEIEALLGIGEAALEDAPELAFSHFRLAERVIRHSRQPERLHEALGGQGRALRRNKRFAEADERYAAAENAAREAGNKAGRVLWMLRRASAHRANDQPDEARSLVEQAEGLLRPPATGKNPLQQYIGAVNLGDRQQLAALVELEGQLGLTRVGEGDEQGAEDHYRSALLFSETAKDWESVSTWATNVGNACARRGAYGEAVGFYEKALEAARKGGKGSGVLNAASRLAACLAEAYRHEEGGDRLRALADESADARLKLALLDRALTLYDQGLCVERAIETAGSIEAAAAGQSLRPEFLAHVRSVREKMERAAENRPAPADGPPALDLFLPEYMARAERSGRFEPALEAAHLVCDVRLALALAGEKHWRRMVGGDLLANAGLDLRVVFDTLRMLLEAGRTDLALDLLQRFKAPSFCVPTLLRLRAEGPTRPEVAAYLAAAGELVEQVPRLAAPARPDFMRTVNAIGRASARMREAGEALREVDPALHARMGGPVRRDELIDSLPYAGGVAVVDFLVGRDATVGVVLARGEAGVRAFPLLAPSFDVTHAHRLQELYAEGNLSKQLGGVQTEALTKISQLLHDHLFCKLAGWLSSQLGVSQLILIPDTLTRNLPLHLARACGQEFHIPGIDTSDANFLCEVMPVEFAPCLQAVAASQVYLRPPKVERVAAFADPLGDLPAARASMEEFGARVGSLADYRLASGEAATKAAVVDALGADVLLFGTHGVFSPGELEQTHLVLSGEPWTMGDMLGMPELRKRALLVLMACEVGAVAATPDDRHAWGIPGALVAAGASAVVANLWPVEDATAGILTELFLRHLGHPGYRPAAALFRAVRDLRRMEKEEALTRLRAHFEQLKQKKAAPRAIVGLRNLIRWVEQTDQPRPFAHPFFWGATLVFGSGWHLPTGASVGPPGLGVENHLRLGEAEDLLRQGQPRKALEAVGQVLNTSDGKPRAYACAMMAQALLDSADISSEPSARRKAARLLRQAARIAANEGDRDLRDRVEWVQSRLEEDDVD